MLLCRSKSRLRRAKLPFSILTSLIVDFSYQLSPAMPWETDEATLLSTNTEQPQAQLQPNTEPLRTRSASTETSLDRLPVWTVSRWSPGSRTSRTTSPEFPEKTIRFWPRFRNCLSPVKSEWLEVIKTLSNILSLTLKLTFGEINFWKATRNVLITCLATSRINLRLWFFNHWRHCVNNIFRSFYK